MFRHALAVAVLCVALPAFGTTRTWTGATSGLWSDPTNWSPAGVPAPADSLVFGWFTPNVMTNDLPAGTSFGQMEFDAPSTLSGNALTLTGDIVTGMGTTINWSADLKIGAPLTIGYNFGSFTGAIDVNGQQLKFFGKNRVSTLNGTGAILIAGGPIWIGSGTFNGTINGSFDLNGSLPNAAVSNGNITGKGTLGSVNVQNTSLTLSPGSSSDGSVNDHTIGTIQTGPLNLAGVYDVDIAPGTGNDQVKVIGSVSLGGILSVTVPTGVPNVGDTFKIIDNDGTDPVNGIFQNLPEGTTFAIGPTTFQISYRGGDGNDVVLTVTAQNKVWTGAVSGLWSDARNWSPQATPIAGEPLRFPAGVPNVMTNDLTGLTVGRMTFDVSYTLGGNPLTLNGDITLGSGANLICNADLTLAGSITLNGSSGTQYNGAINVNGHLLTIASGPRVSALNGTGQILLQPDVIVTGSGTFNGTINGSIDLQGGSIPNAAVSNGTITGNGTLGSVNVQANYLSIAPGTPATHAIGTIQTGPLNLAGFYACDLVAGVGSDLVKVTGSVSLGGTLSLTITGAPIVGDTYEILDNDGTDPVNGTFQNLPEGATFAIGPTTLQISYRGGDGNDVVLTVLAQNKVWTGAVSAFWSDARNWSPQQVPIAGEPLWFPAGVPNAMNNDLPSGFTVGRMFYEANYTLSGNPLTLMGDVTVENSVSLTCNADLKLGLSVTIGGYGSSQYHIIDVNGYQLTLMGGAHLYTLNGTGKVLGGFSITADGTFTGPINGGVYLGNASLPHADLSNGDLFGIGTVNSANLQMLPLFLSPGVTDGGIGTIQTGALNLAGTYECDLVPGTGNDLVKVSGAVSLGGQLIVNVRSGTPAAGQKFLILENDTPNPINGLFKIYQNNVWTFLAEGAEFQAGQWLFSISYRGGDGNDVVLTRLALPALTLTQSSPSTKSGQPVTFTVNATSELGAPGGVVTFLNGSTSLGTVALQNGTATLTTSSLGVGNASIIAVYDIQPPWAAALSSTITHAVSRGDTTTSLTVQTPSFPYGSPAQFTVTVAGVPPAIGTPSGSVSLSIDGTPSGSQTLTNGTTTFTIPLLGAGTHSVVATYAGDTNFNGSTSSAGTETVSKASTVLTATVSPSPAYAGQPIQISIQVRNAGSGPTPSGTASVATAGRVIAQQTLTAGAALFSLGGYGPGDHTFDVTYGGDNNFNPSSASVQELVLPPAISASGVVVTGDAPHTVTIPVTLSAALSLPVTVSFATADGTAHAGDAYVATSGTVTFAPGQTDASITVNTLRNATANALVFTVNFSNAVNASIATPAVTVTIAPAITATTYTYAPGLTIDFYPPATTVTNAPLLVWIPGFDTYDSGKGAIVAIREAARGYAVARVAYRPATQAVYPAQLADLNAAVAWIRTNAALLNVDANRIGAWGEGAGAHLATLLGTSPSAHLIAVVECSGATDLPHLQADALACSTINHDAATSPESSLIGCALPACPGTAANASPAGQVTSTSAATLIVHGDADCVIAPAQATRLYQAFQAANAYALLWFVPGAGHQNVSTAPGVPDQIDEFLDVHLKRSGARPHPGGH